MRIIECASKRLFGNRIDMSEAEWKKLPVTVKFDALNYNNFWFRINEKIYNWNSKEFTDAFNEARAWELLSK